MTLRGTLGDFGLPDIFQLVGHQQKTGVLLLKDRELEVKIYFVEGNVVKAEQSSRERSDLLGSIMVRAVVISAEQLESALATQQRTLRRLGDILIEMGACDRATLKEMARLQTTETIYRLFMWRKGTYEFTATSVDYDDQSYEPIRAENVLMEGFRMVDEWPAVRKVIPSARCTFIVLKQLPAAAPSPTNDDDILAGLAAAMGSDPIDRLGSDSAEAGDAPAGGDEHAVAASGGNRKIGKGERRVFSLVDPAGARTVQDIVDLSRLGEFETSKALSTLVKHGHLRVVLPRVEAKVDQEPFTVRGLWDAVAPVLTRVALYAVVAAAIGGLVRIVSTSGVGMLASGGVDGSVAVIAHGRSPRDGLGEVMRVRLTQAIETFRLLEGHYPDKLEELIAPSSGSEEAAVASGPPDLGLREGDLSFPFEAPYSYRRVQHADGSDGYSLALPLR